MNPNIKKMNPHLWIVNYEHVKSGFIKELNQIKAITKGNDMFAISNEGILIINEVESDLLELIPVIQFVMALEVGKLERTPLKDFLGLKNPKVLEYREDDFKTFIGFHQLEEFSKTFAQIVTIELARRKAQQKYDRKQQIERLKFWKNWR